MINNVPSIVAYKLTKNEEIIFKMDEVDFQVPNKSIVGAHSLFISTKGRVFAYDSGGFLVSASVHVSTYPIGVEFLSNKVVISSDIQETVNYNHIIDIDKFIGLAKKFTASNCFKFNTTSESQCNFAVLEETKYLSPVIINDDGFEISNFKDHTSLLVCYNHIQSYDYNNGLLTLNGNFICRDLKKIYTQINLIIGNEKDLNYLKAFFSSNQTASFKIPEGSKVIYANLTGELNDEYYYQKDIILGVKDDILFCIDANALKMITGFKISSIYYFIEDNKLFIFQNEVILLFNLGEGFESIFNFKKDDKVESLVNNFGYTQEGQPFIIEVSQDKTIFKSSKHKVITDIKNNQIDDIVIIEAPDDSDFVKVNIYTKDSNDLTIHILSKFVVQFMKDVFRHTKLSTYAECDIRQLFNTWANQMKDILNYHFFGSLLCVKEELYALFDENENLSDDNKIHAANILYYQVQHLKKHLEFLSINFPKLIEINEKNLMDSLGVSINIMPFKSLQRQLLPTSFQIQRSLSEIERALSQIPFAIYPETNSRKTITKSRYMQAASGLLGINALGAIINIYNARKMDKSLEEIEKRKIDIYVHQALDSFEHIINVMVPYYLEEVNQAFISSFAQIAQNYTNLLENEAVKQELLERISDMYTINQLPINNTILKPKKYLIEEINLFTKIDFSTTNNNLLKGGM